MSEKKKYTPPAIIYEADLELKAGSCMGDPDPLDLDFFEKLDDGV